MSSFREWLKQQAEKEMTFAQRREIIEEWEKAVAELFGQIAKWLAEDDTDEVLSIRIGRTAIHREEEGLGSYSIDTMTIGLPTKTVDLIPLARNVVGGVGKRGDLGFRAEGRVDMTNGAEKYMLYRAVTPIGKRWVIVDDDKYDVKDLDKDSLEAALQDLLS